MKFKSLNRGIVSNKNGFTLIELLVVIAVIGILASVVLASLNSARGKARDAKRVTDLNQIRSAMELYYNDNGYYPGGNGSNGYSNTPYYYTRYPITTVDDCGWTGASATGVWCDLETQLAGYIPKLPRDTSKLDRYYFKYNAQTNMYGLMVELEKPNTASQNDGGYYADYYEIGGLPPYCKASNLYWIGWDGSSACQ